MKTYTLRRSGAAIDIFNPVGLHIAIVSHDEVSFRSNTTPDEINIVCLVAENFELFHENVIEE